MANCSGNRLLEKPMSEFDFPNRKANFFYGESGGKLLMDNDLMIQIQYRIQDRKAVSVMPNGNDCFGEWYRLSGMLFA